MPKSILIVDDSNSIRQSITFVLEQAGFEVAQAQDGVDAVKKLDLRGFDLVISDVNMPNMDGIALTRHIRQPGKHQFTPILMLTTESQSSMMQEGKSAGATGWIVKPFEPDKLLAVVKKTSGLTPPVSSVPPGIRAGFSKKRRTARGRNAAPGRPS